MENIQIFQNPEFGEVRTLIIDDEPWFVGNDVAGILKYKDKYSALKKNVDDDDKRLCPVGSTSGVQDTTVINESGLYSLIFGSKLETAKKFKHWVTSEVLPQIRKNGSYTMPQICSPSEIPLGELASYLKIMDRVAHRQELAPHKIAENFKKVSEQFGVLLSDDFIKVPKYEQLSLSLEGVPQSEQTHSPSEG